MRFPESGAHLHSFSSSSSSSNFPDFFDDENDDEDEVKFISKRFPSKHWNFPAGSPTF